MIKHQYNTPTKYEFAFIKAGEIVFTMWMCDKSFKKAYYSAAESLADINNANNTPESDWVVDWDKKTISEPKSGTIGKYTGRTLFEVNGTYAR